MSAEVGVISATEQGTTEQGTEIFTIEPLHEPTSTLGENNRNNDNKEEITTFEIEPLDATTTIVDNTGNSNGQLGKEPLDSHTPQNADSEKETVTFSIEPLDAPTSCDPQPEAFTIEPLDTPSSISNGNVNGVCEQEPETFEIEPLNAPTTVLGDITRSSDRDQELVNDIVTQNDAAVVEVTSEMLPTDSGPVGEAAAVPIEETAAIDTSNVETKVETNKTEENQPDTKSVPESNDTSVKENNTLVSNNEGNVESSGATTTNESSSTPDAAELVGDTSEMLPTDSVIEQEADAIPIEETAVIEPNFEKENQPDTQSVPEFNDNVAKENNTLVSNNECNVEASVSTTTNESSSSPEADGKASDADNPLVANTTPDEILMTTDTNHLDDGLQLQKPMAVPTFCRIPVIQIIQGIVRTILSVIRTELKQAASSKVTEEEVKTLELLHGQFEELLQNMAVNGNKILQNETLQSSQDVPKEVIENKNDDNDNDVDGEVNGFVDGGDGDDGKNHVEVSDEPDEADNDDDSGDDAEEDVGSQNDSDDELSDDESDLDETSNNEAAPSFLHLLCDTIERTDVSAGIVNSILGAFQKLIMNDAFSVGAGIGVEIDTVIAIHMIADSLILCASSDAVDSPSLGEVKNAAATRSTISFAGVSSLNGSTRESKISNVFSLSTPEAEQCIFKLLETVYSVFEYSMQRGNILSSDTVASLLNACFHFMQRPAPSSPLLRSVAETACSNIVMTIFRETLNDNVQYRLSIFKNLKEHLQSSKSSAKSVSVLSLMNTAIENTKDQVPSNEEREFLRNDLYKLLLSTAVDARDCSVLESTIRLFLNLWVGMRYQLKCELEVFLQSVHFRALDSPIRDSNAPARRRRQTQSAMSVIGTAEAKEIVLDSMLDIYRLDSNLLREVYFNYDCDVSCSNLYESMISILGRTANPAVSTEKPILSRVRTASTDSNPETMQISGTHRQSSDLTVPVGERPRLQRANSGISTGSFEFVEEKTQSTPVNNFNRLALEGIMSALYSISYVSGDTMSEKPIGDADDLGHPSECIFEVNKEGEVTAVAEETMLSRKRRKFSLQKVVSEFNNDHGGTDWLSLAVDEGIMPKSFPLSSFQAAKVAAEILYMSQDVDKTKLGTFLSKGPEKRYPFEFMVRKEFVALYDFKGMSFPIALRAFLSKFRMPGEAQCIDRIMEVFSREYFDQQDGATIFKNSDAVYVLSFSTIMLNTDLHNRTIKHERMTREQFIRNNRGINAGEDLDEQFLTELYDQIKDRQIQVRREAGDFNKNTEQDDFRTTWDVLLMRKDEVANPVFTSDYDTKARNKFIHDKDMFLIVANASVQALAGVLARSKDDFMVVRTIRGLKHIVEIAASYKVDAIINDIVQILLIQGRDYITTCLALDFASLDEGAAAASKPLTTIDLSDEKNLLDLDQPIPLGLLCCGTNPGVGSITGSAAHRGLLALDSGFLLFRKYGSRINEAWPAFIECLCALRDARALPEGLSELDDFADSNGNVLPLSSFALASKKAIDNYYRSLSEKEAGKGKGWFRSLFTTSKGPEVDDGYGDVNYTPVSGDLSACARALLKVAEGADVEDSVQMGAMKLPEYTVESLLATLEGYPFVNNPVAEQQAVFSLELAARALLSDRDHSIAMFPQFLTSFESLFSKISSDKVACPFVVERVVVAILRSNIHLYEVPELRPSLRTSLQLLKSKLPKSFIRVIADRLACGVAIILRASFQFLETADEWNLMSEMLDMLASFNLSREFIFDGIASTIEYAIPNSKTTDEKDDTHPKLTLQGCECLTKILIRFTLGFYKGDLTLTIPATLCLEKLYRLKVELVLKNEAEKSRIEIQPADLISKVPDKEFWQNVVVAVYSVCRSPDPEFSRHGVDCFRRIVLRTRVEEVSDDKWIAILYLMVGKQPSLVFEASRGNCFTLLGHTLARVLPSLSHKAELLEDLEDLMKQVAALTNDNLRQCQGDSSSTLFQKTLQAATYLSNHMTSDEWAGDAKFSAWASEALLSELEKAGASVAKNEKLSGSKNFDNQDSTTKSSLLSHTEDHDTGKDG